MWHCAIPRTILGNLSKPEARSGPTSGSFPLDKTPYTKCQLRQQTNQALTFVKEASYGEICNLIIRFSHTAEYMVTMADIADAQAQKLCETLKKVPPGKKDRRQMKDASNLAGAMSGGGIMRAMEERDRKDQEKAASQASKQAAKVARQIATKEAADSQLATAQQPPPSTSTPASHGVRPRPRPCPGRAVRIQAAVDPATRFLHSATNSVPRPNYYLPILAEIETEPEDEEDSEHDFLSPFAESHAGYRLRPREVDSPLPRRLHSSK